MSNPTADDPSARSAFAAHAYEQARRAGLSEEAALRAGLKSVCPVSYVFGATGWARLFSLQVINPVPTTPLHFLTGSPMNRGWLPRAFAGEGASIDDLRVPFGEFGLRLLTRGHDDTYAKRQLALTLRFAAEYGGLGARLQHGFGQVDLSLQPEPGNGSIAEGLAELAVRRGQGEFAAHGPGTDTPYDLRNFVSLDYALAPRTVDAILARVGIHIGHGAKKRERAYLPCAFDLRYKGADAWGFRRWLEDPQGNKRWPHDRVNKLMGISKKKGERSDDDDRQASRLCFGMPHRVPGDRYRLRVFGFAPGELLTPQGLRDLCNEYMGQVLGVVEPVRATLGEDLIAEARR